MEEKGHMELQAMQKSYNLDLENDMVLHKITGDDPMLLYVFYLASLEIGLSRINRDLNILVGIPSFDGKNINTIENEISPNSFKSFLQLVKTNLSSSMRKEQNNFNCNINFIISFEGINTNQTEQYDVWFHISPISNGVSLYVMFNDRRCKLSSLDTIIQSFRYVMTESLKNLDINIADLLTINAAEHVLINEYNDQRNTFDHKKLHSIPTGFLDAVQRYENNIAIIENDQYMTYREIDQNSNMLANYLMKKGVDSGHIVAILGGRSTETVISMLAILKIGSAYAPIDANYPKEKIEQFLDNSSFSHVISSSCFLPLINESHMHKVSFLDKEKHEIQVCSKMFNYTENMESLCYVIFTSGSTGTPKVAAVKHIGWSNLLQWFTDQYHINNDDKIYLISSISFDISQRSIFMALINGSTLHLYPDEIYDPQKIKKYILENNISILNCAPSMFYPLIEEYGENIELQALRCLFLGGEAISAQRLVNWYRSDYCKAIISNVYGVAECSDVSSYYELKNFDKYLSESVPIGYPIYNNQLFIVNEEGQYLPPGSVGEICIAGIGIGAGYINDSKFTQEKFVQLQDGLQVYLTGDMGRFTGKYIEYAGRKDYQVKIRGNRVELGDIENAIRQIKFVKEVVVVISKIEQVVGYVEINKDEVSFEQDNQLTTCIYQELRNKLPTYMIPERLHILETIPVNNNGKIDRLKLSQMEIQKKDEVYDNITSSEREVMKIVANVLDVSSINIDENIFDKGMHSILVVKLVALLNKEFSIELAPIDIYLNSTVKKLTDKIAVLRKD